MGEWSGFEMNFLHFLLWIPISTHTVTASVVFDYIEFSEPCAQRIHFRPLSLCRVIFVNGEFLLRKTRIIGFSFNLDYAVINFRDGRQHQQLLLTINAFLLTCSISKLWIFCLASFRVFGLRVCDWLKTNTARFLQAGYILKAHSPEIKTNFYARQDCLEILHNNHWRWVTGEQKGISKRFTQISLLVLLVFVSFSFK